MRPVAVSLVLAAALLAAAPALAAPRPAAAAVPPAIVEGTNGFALDLYGQLRQKPGNLCFSPASVSLALAMTAAGAQGDTAKEMAKVLRFRLAAPALHAGMGALVRELESAGGGAPELRIANRLFVQQGKPLQPEFAALTKEHYAAAAEVVSFVRAAEKARRAINGWVSDRTNGRIRDLIGAGVLTAATRLVLVNAIYFKADWQHQFEKHATYNEPFLVTPTQKRPVAMMHQTTSAGYAETRDTLVLELPYRGTAERDLALVIVLPRAADGLAKVEQGLDVARLAAYVKALRRERVDVALPRFKLDAAFGVGDPLQALGMRLAFDRDKADFSGIMPRSEQLFISAVIHKAFVAVDEKGTEAAAATAVVMLAGAKAPTPGKTFRADHPFTFFLRDRRSGAILFIGRVADPA